MVLKGQWPKLKLRLLRHIRGKRFGATSKRLCAVVSWSNSVLRPLRLIRSDQSATRSAGLPNTERGVLGAEPMTFFITSSYSLRHRWLRSPKKDPSSKPLRWVQHKSTRLWTTRSPFMVQSIISTFFCLHDVESPSSHFPSLGNFYLSELLGFHVPPHGAARSQLHAKRQCKSKLFLFEELQPHWIQESSVATVC